LIIIDYDISKKNLAEKDISARLIIMSKDENLEN